MMSTHTPGPWTYDEDSKWVVSGWFGIHQVPTGNVNSKSEHLANARLIAAAPRMLDTLRRIANETCDHGAGFCPRDEARAILRDVEGESNG